MSGRARTIITWVVGVLAVLALTASTVAVWARATVAEADTFGDITADVLEDAAVRQALADRVATQVLDAVGLDELLDSLFVGPLGRLGRLRSSIGAGVESAVSSRLERLLDSDRVQGLVVAAVERAHGAAIDLLRGDGLVDGVSVGDGRITLNLLPLVGLALGQVQDLGLLDDVTVPDLSRSGDPAEQIAELSGALGRDLPADLGQIVVYEGDEVASATASVQQAQRAVAVGLRAIWLLVVLTVVLIAATLLLARARWQALLLLSLGVLATMVVVRSIVHRVVDEAPNLATGPAGANTVAIVLDELSAGLLTLCAFLLLVAVVCGALGIVRRRARRGDLEVAVAVVLGAAVVGLLGISIVSLVLGIAVAIGAVVIGRQLVRGPGDPHDPVPEPTAVDDAPATTA